MTDSTMSDDMTTGLDDMRDTPIASLYEMALALSSAVDLSQMLAVVLQQVRSALNSDAGLIMLATADGQALRIEAADGDGTEGLIGLECPLDQGINAWIYRTGQPALVQDADSDPRRLHVTGSTDLIRAAVGAPLVADGQVIGTVYAAKREPNSFSPEHLHFLTITASQVAVPITVRGQVLGAIVAQSYEPYAFTERHQRLLSGIASQAAISLQNARLLSELRLVNADLEEMVRTQAYLLHHIAAMAAGQGAVAPSGGVIVDPAHVRST